MSEHWLNVSKQRVVTRPASAKITSETVLSGLLMISEHQMIEFVDYDNRRFNIFRNQF